MQQGKKSQSLKPKNWRKELQEAEPMYVLKMICNEKKKFFKQIKNNKKMIKWSEDVVQINKTSKFKQIYVKLPLLHTKLLQFTVSITTWRRTNKGMANGMYVMKMGVTVSELEGKKKEKKRKISRKLMHSGLSEFEVTDLYPE